MQVIRALQDADVESVIQMDKTCFPDPWTKEMWKGELSRSDARGLVVEQDGQIVGFALTTVLFEDAELPKIAVQPTCRGLGLGKILLCALEKTAKDCGAERMFLEVRAGNIPARKLYEGNGYETLRVRKKYYPDGEDALEMQKRL
ncbi:MAG: ribosomal protein S18-alanine N-acetyltransferase [Clostridia bacterium]|nr:ribosomal protein S18-alanine N-acetyltransferase [Clostridia bacterium]